jgi:hypothetical protein
MDEPDDDKPSDAKPSEDATRSSRLDAEGWMRHPLHPTRARFDGQRLVVEQQTPRALRIGPLLSAAVMAWLTKRTSWDADDDTATFWGVAFAVMGDWPVRELGMLQLVRGGDGKPGLRRKRKPARIQHDLSSAWRGTRKQAPWLDLSTTGVVPLVLHYQQVAQEEPALWGEVQQMAEAALGRLEGRSAYHLARVLDLLPPLAARCAYCGAQEAEMTFDHAHPLEAGGAPWGQNLVTACRACNQRKGATPLEAWLEGRALHDPAAVEAARATLGAPRPALLVKPAPQ